MDQLKRSGPTAIGDGADIPDDRALFVEIGRADQQYASLAICVRDIGKHPRIAISFDEAEQRCRVGQSIAEECSVDPAHLQNVGRRDRRAQRAQAFVIGTAEERERSDQRASADPGYKLTNPNLK